MRGAGSVCAETAGREDGCEPAPRRRPWARVVPLALRAHPSPPLFVVQRGHREVRRPVHFRGEARALSGYSSVHLFLSLRKASPCEHANVVLRIKEPGRRQRNLWHPLAFNMPTLGFCGFADEICSCRIAPKNYTSARRRRTGCCPRAVAASANPPSAAASFASNGT